MGAIQLANQIEFNGDIIIGDPCEMVTSEQDWEICEYGEHFERLGIEKFLWFEYDECEPAVYDDNNNRLGSFCTDSSVIAVMYLEDLLKYNNSFDQHITYPENWTVIHNFIGTVCAETDDNNTVIVGKGNICFHTVCE